MNVAPKSSNDAEAGLESGSGVPAVPFGSRVIGPGAPVAVIAEIGINHEGDAGTCARMIEAAAAAGADAIKLQTIDADENYVRGTESYELFHKSGLGREGTAEMFEFARRNGVEPFTTAGDPATLEWVDRLAPAAHKFSSGLLTNGPLIRRAAETGRTLLMSTGMAEVADVDAAVAAAVGDGRRPVGLFQCTSLYPAPPETLNLATCAKTGSKDSVQVVRLTPMILRLCIWPMVRRCVSSSRQMTAGRVL